MDNERHGLRASGDYATYDGNEYFAHDLRDRVRLLTDADPLPAGFRVSGKSWVLGENIVSKSRVERLVKVETTCDWRGHRFRVGIILGDVAYVTYLGNDFDTVCRLPGMERPDKYEVIGEVPVSELTQMEVRVEEVSLSDER
ncbi:hypothetical protein [Mycolicibacterium sp. HK-90]|uniref:hypothetical protein n=1 Tax=Mycolicibacterium sp. HK-90 TaxID=3056937 RepID=UPI002657B683|nr:hypothetical protein [Mycolicibacterium sp. HK-90]WKG03652.1 hypothetical protein QU592_00415 [Mycolicibacterium sp. HK-90]